MVATYAVGVTVLTCCIAMPLMDRSVWLSWISASSLQHYVTSKLIEISGGGGRRGLYTFTFIYCRITSVLPHSEGSCWQVVMWLLVVQDQPLTSDCDKDVMSLCLREKGLNTFPIGQVKKCLVNLGVPQDPSILLAAEVREVLSPCCILTGLLL